MRHGTLLAALGCAAMVLAGAAHAAEDSSSRKDPALEEARQHAANAKVHYDLGEFEKAAEEYILVYRLRPLPALLFNIAQSYRQAAQYDKAKQFYRAYLRENPDSQTTAAVKKALKEIDELLAKEKKTREAPPSGVRDAPASDAPVHDDADAAGRGDEHPAGADSFQPAGGESRRVAAHARCGSRVGVAGADGDDDGGARGAFILAAHMDLRARRRVGRHARRGSDLRDQGQERRQRADLGPAHDRDGG
ncbi:MAG: tetratricopeptide repeat protein [Deltaproteobacteria bacterium]|nr:MAG: tetratricopeptide repeat protein [Deltaproteobacteria bacterium]